MVCGECVVCMWLRTSRCVTKNKTARLNQLRPRRACLEKSNCELRRWSWRHSRREKKCHRANVPKKGCRSAHHASLNRLVAWSAAHLVATGKRMRRPPQSCWPGGSSMSPLLSHGFVHEHLYKSTWRMHPTPPIIRAIATNATIFWNDFPRCSKICPNNQRIATISERLQLKIALPDNRNAQHHRGH